MELPERVASDLRIIAENIEPLKTAVEQLHELLEYVYRNRAELTGILNPQGSPLIPESVSCVSCDDSADSIKEATGAGWVNIEQDLAGTSWNYLGQCPDCQKAEAEQDAKLKERQENPIRSWYEVMKSGVDKADRKPYVPLSGVEHHLLLTQGLITKTGKLTKAGREKFRELDNEKQEEERKDIGGEGTESTVTCRFCAATAPSTENAKEQGWSSIVDGGQLLDYCQDCKQRHDDEVRRNLGKRPIRRDEGPKTSLF